ncbi:MAG TPA: hypothetical protein VM345_14755 [Acidimicrobiales bacterium]|jgi:uncharacterized membrane protein|nr:hypothetical protein [Acidimicrobiales bacterium]
MPAVVLLRTPAVTVEPGGEAVAELTIKNTGTVVDQFVVNLLGEASAWARCDPAAVSLFPGAEETVNVRFTPPRSASVTAGAVAFGVQVTSQEDREFSVVEEGTVSVGGFSALTLKVVPRTSQGKRAVKHRVEITNAGNAPLQASLDAIDPDAQLAFDFDPHSIEVPAGGEAVAQLRIVASAPAKGGIKRHSFTVSVESNGVTSTADAAFEQKPRGPILIWLAVLVVAAVLVFLLRDTAEGAELGVLLQSVVATTALARMPVL